MYGLLGQYLAEIELLKKKKKKIKKKKYIYIYISRKITFKVVQIYHISNHKFSFDVFMVGNLQNTLMEHGLYLIF